MSSTIDTFIEEQFKNLTPFVSTHFKCVESFRAQNLVKGKIYRIEKWYVKDGEVCLDFTDECRQKVSWARDHDVEDYSYFRNLENILKD